MRECNKEKLPQTAACNLNHQITNEEANKNIVVVKNDGRPVC